jgi:predicted nuclease of restriction endonuclease-like (RecB) superfamily
VQERWGKRELERQFRLAAFEHAVLAPPRLSPAVAQTHGDAAAGVFKDAYAIEFLNLPADHTEADLHRGLLGQLRAFLIELGRDFSFVGSSSRFLGTVISHSTCCSSRGLNCLVAIELKVDRFEPEHLGKLTSTRSLDRCAQATRKPGHWRFALRVEG